MDANGVLNGLHIGSVDRAKLAFETGFVSSHDLVCHGFAALAINRHHRLAGVLTACVAGQGHDHHAGEVSVGGIVAHKIIDSAYGYQMGAVLFKPKLTVAPQTFRTTRGGALAYFVGGTATFPKTQALPSRAGLSAS